MKKITLIAFGLAHISASSAFAAEICVPSGPYDTKLHKITQPFLDVATKTGDEWHISRGEQTYGPFKNINSNPIFIDANNYSYLYTEGEGKILNRNGEIYGPFMNIQEAYSADYSKYSFAYSENNAFYIQKEKQKYGPFSAIGTSVDRNGLLYSPDGRSFSFFSKGMGDGWMVNKDGKKYGAYDDVFVQRYSPDGKSFAFSFEQGGAFYIHKDGKDIGPLQGKVLDMVYLPDNELLFAATGKNTLHITYRGKTLGPFPFDYLNANQNLRISKDGKHFIMAYPSQGQVIWNRDGIESVMPEGSQVISEDGDFLIRPFDATREYHAIGWSSEQVYVHKKTGGTYIHKDGIDYLFADHDSLDIIQPSDGSHPLIFYTKGRSFYVNRCLFANGKTESAPKSENGPTSRQMEDIVRRAIDGFVQSLERKNISQARIHLKLRLLKKRIGEKETEWLNGDELSESRKTMISLLYKILEERLQQKR